MDKRLKNIAVKLSNKVKERISVIDDLQDEAVYELIEEEIFRKKDLSYLPAPTVVLLAERVFSAVRSDMDILQKYVEDAEVSEIMVNGKDNIFIERRGKIEKTADKFDTTEELNEVIHRVAGKVNRQISEMDPIVDARLSDGSRVNAVYGNVAIGGPAFTVRKFPKISLRMNDLIEYETITKEAGKLLKLLVGSGYNLFISGGTSSGKTTFLNALSDSIPTGERIVVIEDSMELKLNGLSNVVRLECKPKNAQGRGEVSMRHLIRSSLRMRPDRIIVGEVRGGEIIEMIQAMNTGHDGSLSTGHGTGVAGMLKRMEAMFLQAGEFPVDAIREQIAQAIDIVVQLAKIANTGRRVTEICEIVNYEGGRFKLNPIYRFTDGKLVKTHNELVNTEKMKLNGYYNEYLKWQEASTDD